MMAGAARLGGPKALGVIARRGVFYLLFALVTAFTMNRDVFTLGVYMLVVPALLMVAIQWAFLILPLIDWPLTAWRHTRRPGWAAAWLLAALALPVGFPIAANLWQAAQAKAGRMGDRLPGTPAPPRGTILISGDCGPECTRLVTGGTVERLLQAEHYGLGERYDRDWQGGHYRSASLKYASTFCDHGRRDKVYDLRDYPGWCLVERRIDNPAFGAVIHFEGYYGTNRNRGRRRIEVWRCEDRCRLVARQTEFKQRRFAVPLRIAYPGGGTFIDPEFKRLVVQSGDADPARVVRAGLGLDYGAEPPQLGEDPVLAARDEAAFRVAEADRKAREESARQARLEESDRARAAELADAARERQMIETSRKPHTRNCVTSEAGGIFRSSCSPR